MKKRIIFCFLLFISCLLSCNSHNGKNKSEKLTSAIENDCEQLKQYLSNCAIDISYAIDDGLNIEVCDVSGNLYAGDNGLNVCFDSSSYKEGESYR